MSTVCFSVLSYYPSFITNENINIGILFYVPDNNQAIFHSITKWDRAKAFDDELDIDFMKDYLKGIADEVEDHLFSCQSDFDFEGFIKFYVNEYKFSSILTVQIDHIENFIDNTQKMYLKFDYEKVERLNKNQERQYINKLLKSSDIPYSRKRIKGGFNENIQYDYIIGEYAVKLFTFEGKNLSYLISSAKMWAYNAAEIKGKYKTIFIYDKEMKESEYYDAIIKILEQNAYKIMAFQEGIDYLLSLKRDQLINSIAI